MGCLTVKYVDGPIPDPSIGMEIIKPPEFSDWECELLFWTWVPEKGKVPNFFHRRMQSLLLGAKWRKINNA